MSCNHPKTTINKCHCGEKVIGGKYFICRGCSYTYCALLGEEEWMIDALMDKRLVCPLCGSRKVYFDTPLSVIGLLPSSKMKIGRNDPCPCLSGKKYKRCCLKI